MATTKVVRTVGPVMKPAEATALGSRLAGTLSSPQRGKSGAFPPFLV